MSYPANLSRRQFVKTFSYGVAFSMVMGKPWRATVLADFAPLGASNTGILKVNLSDYPALLDILGSVRLGFTPLDEFTGLPVGLNYPIIINRATSTLFYALDSYCHHEGCVVPVYDAIDDAIICPCHGSTYAIDGTLVSNGPASGPLTSYPVTFDSVNTLSIQVPGLGYSVEATAAEEVTPPRIKLDFPTLAAVEYEVLFRSRLRDPWTVAPFSFTIDGPTDEPFLTGDDLPATVFVERTTPTGFYSVAMKILDLSEI